MELLDIVLTAVNAIAPVCLLTVLGYLLKCKGLLSPVFVKNGNWLVFHILLPAMLFINVYDIRGLGDIDPGIVAFAVLVTLVLFVLGAAVAMAVTDVPKRRGVLLQAIFRSNFASIGLPLAEALGGSQASGVAAVISSATIPLFNVLAVISLTIFVDREHSGRGSIKNVLSNILTNPLIWAIGLGLLCLSFREVQTRVFGSPIVSLKTDLKFLYSVLTQLKNATTPLALIILGAQFEFSAVKELRKEIITGTFLRLVAAPVLGIGAAVLLSNAQMLACGTNEYPALIALFGSPVAVSSAIMAGAMKNDEQLAAQLVVWTCLFSIVTIFLQVCILLSMGMIAA